MTEGLPPEDPPVGADGPETPHDVDRDEGWPQLSDLDLDVCLSATLPRDRMPAGPARLPPTQH